MNSLTVILLVVLTAVPVAAAEKTIDIKPESPPLDKVYPWITYMTQGPIKWSLDENEQDYGIAYRVIITTAEIYNGIIIEKIMMGEEGCCKVISNTIELDIMDLQDKMSFEMEFANVSFDKWEAFNEFRLLHQDRLFQVIIGDKRNIIVIEKNQANKAK